MKKAVKIFSNPPQLNCEICGKNLLEENNTGNYIVFTNEDGSKLECIKYACKEHDHVVVNRSSLQNLRDTGWKDIDDLCIPSIWIQKLMVFVNEMHNANDKISDVYFKNFKDLLMNTFPYIARGLDKNEMERVNLLLSIGI